MIAPDQHRSENAGTPWRPALALLLPLLLLAGPLSAAEASFRLPGLQGGTLSPTDLTKEAVIVVVWDPSSPECMNIVSRVNRLVDKWSPRARVLTVVSQGAASKVSDFLTGEDLKAPVFHDSEGAFRKLHKVTGVPWMVLYNEGSPSLSALLPIDPDPPITSLLD